MSDIEELSKADLVVMVEGLEQQLKDLYLEKRLAGLDRDGLVAMIGHLEEQHSQMVGSLSSQLADLYESKSKDSAPGLDDLSSLKSAA